MCFEIHAGYKEPFVAKKDVVCYKVMKTGDNGTYVSFHRYFAYEKNKTYNLEEPMKIYFNEIEYGFHSFTSYNKACSRSNNDPVIKCVIPKGSTYYYNPCDKEYVADSILILKEVDTPLQFVRKALKFFVWFLLTFFIVEELEIVVKSTLKIDLMQHNILNVLVTFIVLGFKFHLFCCVLPFVAATLKCRHKKCDHKQCKK